MRWGLLFLILSVTSMTHAQDASGENVLAISQGVSSPSMNHSTLFSNGFTMDNPMAGAYQSGYHLTGALDGTDSTSFGAEFGVGDGQYGLGLGLYSNSCEECSAFARATLGAIWGGFAMGLGVQEDLYTFGAMFSPQGTHRIGIVMEHEDRDGVGNLRNAYALGYAYIISQFSFSLDVSTQRFESPLRDDDPVLVSPGIGIRVDTFSISVSYDMYMMNDQQTYQDKVWLGLGTKLGSWNFVFYGEHTDRWTLLGTYSF